MEDVPPQHYIHQEYNKADVGIASILVIKKARKKLVTQTTDEVTSPGQKDNPSEHRPTSEHTWHERRKPYHKIHLGTLLGPRP